MTPLPKRRWSTRRQGKKRNTLKSRSARGVTCPNCGETKIAHVVCPKCGFYKGQQVIAIKVKKPKKELHENPV